MPIGVLRCKLQTNGNILTQAIKNHCAVISVYGELKSMGVMNQTSLNKTRPATNLYNNMNSNPQDEELRKRIHSIFPSETIAKRAVDMLTSDKPEGWGHRSSAPYFKEYYGLEMKGLIDDSMKTYQSIVYDYETFCNPRAAHRVSERTVYNRVNQSLRYVLERLDTPEKKYYKWRQTVEVHPKAGLGVVISYIAELVAAQLGQLDGLPKPRLVTPSTDIPRWKRDLDKWLENSENNEPFVKENLALSPAEQEQLKTELFGLSNIEYSVSVDSVKLIKINLL